MTDTDARFVFSRWLRIKLQHEEKLQSRYEYLLKSPDPLSSIFMQIAADADHSTLLQRMLSGKEPLPEPPPLKHGYPVYPEEETT